MKLPREVKIRIRPGGRVEIDTEGFVGTSCTDLSEFFEKLLAGDNPGDDRVQRDLKPEYYLVEQDQETGLEDRSV